ncbi:gluconeogenesis factor YvcK family protein [Cellulosilyticum sp. I15G10I2]|uniref:gluconeogenesis factor YvcK family protein n=1 Tax=Cellulosilyticum sp. I15G10I2 TaxID=1892843 RepID=UPI00085C2155|nr:YvcK family protein [Cellulosilyticum sp. I15G10I2]
MKMRQQEPKVVVIGGGTGLSAMLKGIKKYTSHISAVVTVADNGGGSGKIREEMGIMPPGDIRNCLVALANTEPIMEKVLQYRFKEGSLKGQNLGNLFLAALTDITGSFEQAVKLTGNVLAITGKVIPVTLENIHLCAQFENGKSIEGETQIVEYGKLNQSLIKEIALNPTNPRPVKEVIYALQEADLIILGPGSLYTSLIPNLLVDLVPMLIERSRAKKIYVANIMSQPGETTGFSIEEHLRILEKYIGNNVIHSVIVNNEIIPDEYLNQYIEEGADILRFDPQNEIWHHVKRVEAPLVKIFKDKKFVRHDSEKLAECIFKEFFN